MLGIIRNILIKIREPWLESARWVRQSYAQEGEDLAIDRLFGNVSTGFYVEVGSHHPFRFSNTYLFYRRGWNGICIDPLPESKTQFNKWRPRDIALEVGVSSTPAIMKYYLFNESALNTFDPLLAKEYDGLSNYKNIEVKDIAVLPLSDILDKYLPANKNIDFLSVDAEGLDLKVLQSNNWNKYRPKAVIAECIKSNLVSIGEDPIACYLATVGYKPYAKTGLSIIFT